MKRAIGVLTYGRPVHTALTLAYLFSNKDDLTDVHVFYGIHRGQQPPSACLDEMLKALNDRGIIGLHYMLPNMPNNTGGNVDTLMYTLSSMRGYRCWIKIDDDVLIGRGTDVLMDKLLAATEPEGVLLLMGQVVRQHIPRSNPFAWEFVAEQHRVVQRSRGHCPMETYTACSYDLMPFFTEKKLSPSCDDTRGTYIQYTRKVTDNGARVGLVLDPPIQMQHIGLTSTIERGHPSRDWAPATSWNPPGHVIQIPAFDFDLWEKSHESQTQKRFALDTIARVCEFGRSENVLQEVMSVLSDYSPGEGDVDLPPARIKSERARPVSVITRTVPQPGRKAEILPPKIDPARTIPVKPAPDLNNPPRLIRPVRTVNRVLVQKAGL